MENNFGYFDYVLLAATILFSLSIGVYYAFIKKQKTADDLLMGGRSMSLFPVACSLMATNLSATSILGSPAEVYRNGSMIFNIVIWYTLFSPLWVYMIVPTFYKLKLTSVYEYLELRFDSTAVRSICSLTFLFQMIIYMGIVLYAPSIAMKTFIGLPIWLSIVMLGLCATIYTAIGGIRAVVWTDVFQAVIMLAGLMAIFIKSYVEIGSVSKIFEIADEVGRLDVIDWRLDPFTRYTTSNFIVGIFFMSLCWSCTSQMVVQRFSSMPTMKKCMQVMLLHIPMMTFTYGLSVVCGITLVAIYIHCDPVKLGLVRNADEIVPYFVVDYLAFIPGMLGLFLSCLVSASLSTLSSGLNSVAAIIWADFLAKMSVFKKMTAEGQGVTTKITAFLFGCLSIGFGYISSNLGDLFTMSFAINGSLTGPLGGSFILGFFFPCANKWGAIFGMIAGHMVTLYISIGSVVSTGKFQFASLPSDIYQCSSDVLAAAGLNDTSTTILQTAYAFTNITTEASTFNPCAKESWTSRIFETSYLFYTPIGVMVTLTVGIIVSLLTGRHKMTEGKECYINPDVVRLTKWCRRTFISGYSPVPVKTEVITPQHVSIETPIKLYKDDWIFPFYNIPSNSSDRQDETSQFLQNGQNV